MYLQSVSAQNALHGEAVCLYGLDSRKDGFYQPLLQSLLSDKLIVGKTPW